VCSLPCCLHPWCCLCRFAKAAISIGQLRLILPNGEERLYGGGPDTVPAPMPEGK
jgi:hypothetical protein